MPRIRRIIPKGYTTVNNDFLRDTELSLTARGLLITMLSLPDGWNMSGRGLASILPDGRDKVFSALKTLEQRGYLKREKIRENGRFVDVEYQFCDSPMFLTGEYEKSGDSEKSQKKPPKKKKSLSEKTKENKNKSIDFSSISARKEERVTIEKQINSLEGGKLEEYVAEKVLEKQKCLTELGISEVTFNRIVSVFTDICVANPELRNKMIDFSYLDIAFLYEKIKKKKKIDQIVENFFLKETPLWNK